MRNQQVAFVSRRVVLLERVERTESLPVSREEVWGALTQPDQLSDWFGATAIEADIRPGGRLVFRDEDGIVRRALVEAVEPNERLAFRWLPMEQGPGGETWPATPAHVEFRLTETPGGTDLTVTETPLLLART